MKVPPLVNGHGGPIHIAVDSTGLKIMGDGEWHAHKHRTSNRRRAWRKLHLAVDGQGFTVASELTDSGVDDASVGVAMIERIEAELLVADINGDDRDDLILVVDVGWGTIPTCRTRAGTGEPARSGGSAS